MSNNQKLTQVFFYICNARNFFSITIFTVFLMIYILRLDRVCGMYVDDAWYVLLGKAIATGKGYTMINSPTPELLPPLYPPAFPFILSLVFRIAPEFPQNIFLLKSISIIAMIGAGAITYQYCKLIRCLSRGVSLGIASVVFLSPWAVLLTTSMVMSDAVFMLGSLLVIFTVELYVLHKPRYFKLVYLVCISSLMAFTFLTRSIAIGLIFSVIIYILPKHLWRETVLCLALLIVFVVPWIYYANTHAATPDQLREQNGYVTQNYKNHFFSKKASVAILGRESFLDLPDRVWRNAKFLVTRALGEVVIPGNLYQVGSRGITKILLVQLLTVLIVVGFIFTIKREISLSEIYVAISLAMFAIWPFQETRYLLPILPFLILYILEAGQALLISTKAGIFFKDSMMPNGIFSIVVWGLVAYYTWGHFQYIYNLQQSSVNRSIFIEKYEESEKIINWIDLNITKDQVIATDNPPLVYLLTGNKTISSDELITTSVEPLSSRPYWNKLKVKYVVGAWVPPYFLQFTSHSLIYKPQGNAYLRVAEIATTDSLTPVLFLSTPQHID